MVCKYEGWLDSHRSHLSVNCFLFLSQTKCIYDREIYDGEGLEQAQKHLHHLVGIRLVHPPAGKKIRGWALQDWLLSRKVIVVLDTSSWIGVFFSYLFHSFLLCERRLKKLSGPLKFTSNKMYWCIVKAQIRLYSFAGFKRSHNENRRHRDFMTTR